VKQPKVWTFFYGSYINLNVLNEVDLVPEQYEVAKLSGFDIRIKQRSAKGVVTKNKRRRPSGWRLLFRAFDRWHIKADVNGSYNIVRKTDSVGNSGADSKTVSVDATNPRASY
jgi:hypothetical protein